MRPACNLGHRLLLPTQTWCLVRKDGKKKTGAGLPAMKDYMEILLANELPDNMLELLADEGKNKGKTGGSSLAGLEKLLSELKASLGLEAVGRGQGLAGTAGVCPAPAFYWPAPKLSYFLLHRRLTRPPSTV